MSKRDRGFAGVLTSASPALTIGGLTSMSAATGLEMFTDAAGGVDPTFAAVMAGRPVLRGSSRHVRTVLGTLGIDGLECATLAATWQKAVAYGTRATTGLLRATLAKALLLPRQLSVSQDQAAELSVEAIGISADGSNPLSTATNASLPSDWQTAEAYTIGPVSVNGTQLDLESLELDFGLQEAVEANEGQAWPTLAYVASRAPQITLGARSLFTAADLGIAGAELVSFTAYLRALDANGYRQADGTAEHVKLTATGHVRIEDVSGAPDTPATTNVVLTPVKDGGAILTIDASAAIA